MTLVEVLAAAAIIAVGLAAIAGAIPFAAYGTQEGKQLSTATFLANERLEQVRRARWQEGPPPVDDVGVSPSATAAPASPAGITFPDEASLAAPFADYARSVRITDCASGSGCDGVTRADLRQVVVTVTYRPLTAAGTAAADVRKSATLTTYVAKR